MTGGEIFVWFMVGLFVFLLLFILALGLFYPGTGAEQVRWRPTRSPEVEAQNEVDDLAQMLEATNEKRRARGMSEITEGTMEERVREDRRLRDALLDRAKSDAELEQLREARDAARRRREDRS